MLYRPSELKLFLQELGISAKKSLSQNFLIDGNILEKICRLAEVQLGDHILEIGPGPGALTEALLKKGALVTAVEKDKTFAKVLNRLGNHLVVIEEDFLTIDLESLLKSSQKFKVVANLPYQITTPILSKLVPCHHLISSIVVMVQKEVATRFVALPNTADYSSFTLFLQFYGNTTYGFTVGPNCFYPPPKVHSAVVKIDLKPCPNISTDRFFQMTRMAFQQRRKMLRVSLKKNYPYIEEALMKLDLGLTCRPEQLSLEQFISLYQELNKPT